MQIITFSPPLPCVACGLPATVAPVYPLGDDDGYSITPLCQDCADKAAALYLLPLDLDGDEDGRQIYVSG